MFVASVTRTQCEAGDSILSPFNRPAIPTEFPSACGKEISKSACSAMVTSVTHLLSRSCGCSGSVCGHKFDKALCVSTHLTWLSLVHNSEVVHS